MPSLTPNRPLSHWVAVGTNANDKRNGRDGRITGVGDPLTEPQPLSDSTTVYLRPLGGGYEWEARAGDLIPLPEENTIPSTTAKGH